MQGEATPAMQGEAPGDAGRGGSAMQGEAAPAMQGEGGSS